MVHQELRGHQDMGTPRHGEHNSTTLPLSPPHRVSPSSPTGATKKPPYKIIVIGASLGGLRALEVLLAGLPKSLNVPVAIAQHRHRDSNEALSRFLQEQCALAVVEAEDKQAIRPGCVYLAPPDYHLLVEPGHFALSTDAPVRYARPSINVLFESAADVYGKNVIGVILTGSSDDGTEGLLSIKAQGGVAIVQEPSTAESAIMPKAAIQGLQRHNHTAQARAVDWILPLGEIAPLLVNLCQSALR